MMADDDDHPMNKQVGRVQKMVVVFFFFVIFPTDNLEV